MIDTDQPFTVLDHPLQNGDGVVGASRLPIGGGEVCSGGQRGRVIDTDQPFTVLDHPLLNGDGVVGASRLPIGAGEVRSGGQRGRVIDTEKLVRKSLDDFKQRYRAAIVATVLTSRCHPIGE